MKLSYHRETDSLYIDLAERPRVESQEISEGVVIDFDEEGKVVGVDLDHASQKVELVRLVLSKFPGEVEDTTRKIERT
jgi:uncharacterized protein YuzE